MGGDEKGPSFFLNFKYSNKQDVLIPEVAFKIVDCYYIKSYEQFKMENFKIWDRFPMRKTAKIHDGHKRRLTVA